MQLFISCKFQTQNTVIFWSANILYCIKKTFLFICFQNIFSEFITIEMLFHGKALEIYTAAYQNIQNIDENEDLEVRVTEIWFSVYFLHKNRFHSSATHVPHRKMQQILQVPRTNSCIPSFFFFFLHFFSKRAT